MNKQWQTQVLLAGFIAVASLFTSCKKSGSADGNTIPIGEFASLTGSEAAFGRSSHNGTLLAVEDINAAGGSSIGISDEKIAAVDDYTENPLFTPAERAALRYAEEMTLATVDVPDLVFEELKRHFNTEEIVDLTAIVAMENMRARFNRALQVESDGFCDLRAHRAARST